MERELAYSRWQVGDPRECAGEGRSPSPRGSRAQPRSGEHGAGPCGAGGRTPAPFDRLRTTEGAARPLGDDAHGRDADQRGEREVVREGPPGHVPRADPCLMDSEQLYQGLPYAVRYGKTLAYTLERISVSVQPEERLVGSVKEIIPTPTPSGPPPSASWARWWKGGLEKIQEGILWFYSYGWLKNRPPWFHSFGHLALDWEQLVGEGLGAFEARAPARCWPGPSWRRDPAKRSFLRGRDPLLPGPVRLRPALRRRGGARAAAVPRPGPGGRAARHGRLLRAPGRRPGPILPRGAAARLAGGHAAAEGVRVRRLQLQPHGPVPAALLPARPGRRARSAASRRSALLHEFYEKNNEIISPTDHMSQELEATKVHARGHLRRPELHHPGRAAARARSRA